MKRSEERKARKLTLSKFGQVFHDTWKNRANVHPDYCCWGGAERARATMVWYRIKWYLTLACMLAFITTLINTLNMEVTSFNLLWPAGVLLFGISSGMFIVVQWETREERPGSNTARLARDWNLIRRKLIKQGLIESAIYCPNQPLADFMNGKLATIARMVRDHEVEGRKFSKNRRRKELSRLKALSDDLGLKTTPIKELFPNEKAA